MAILGENVDVLKYRYMNRMVTCDHHVIDM